MSLKETIQNAIDTMKDGILNITEEMQSEESVQTIHIRKDRKFGSTQTIVINGNCTFTSDNCIAINIEGDVHSVDTQGSVTCRNVTGDIKTMGSVHCDDVGGKVDTQGSVKCGDVNGSVKTMGSVKANNVKGDIDTMGKVTINSRG